VVGVYDNFEDAKKSIDIEEMNRGGKYECRINDFTLNTIPEELNSD
jgi:hypothetical protein